MKTQTRTSMDAWWAFLKAHSVVLGALDREMQEDRRLPLAWFDVLAFLNRTPDGQLRMQVLAESIYLTKSGLTRLLDRMVTAGLVERQTCPEDRRGWYAAITAEGKKALESALPKHIRGVEEHFFSHFSDAEIGVLHSLLSRLTNPKCT
jgi:DNA-binding MarR family transcriptional regulator